MKRIFIFIIAPFISGCIDISPRDNLSPRDNISPKLNQDINNTNGRIDRIENNQNALRAEIDNISLIHKENSGIQILQGDGALIMIFATITVIFICIYFHRVAENYRKTAEILAAEINDSNDENLKLKVMKASQHTETYKHVCRLIKR